MKYSILLPYYKRPELWNTLRSFVDKYSDRNDYEVIVIEDSKNADDSNDHFLLLDTIKCFKNELSIRHFMDDVESFNPAHKYNLGFAGSKGKFIVLSSPEIKHESDVLGGFDKALEEDPNAYYVCACQAVDGDKPPIWYQHSIHRNVLFHFCSVMSQENFIKIGMFDEAYCAGIGFDDEDLVYRLIQNGIKICPKDDLLVTHIEHSREYMSNYKDLIEINRNIYLSKIGTTK